MIENRKVLDLPLNGRNILSLTALTTGVTPGNGFGIGIPDGRASLVQAAAANVLINGGMSAQNDVLIDGVPTSTCCQNQISFIPSIDTTQEFRVRANMYDAQYGRTGGGLMTFATRSGTNEFHGSLFEFLRNRQLDANHFFNNRAGIEKSHFVYNQFGGRLGGRIIRNRLFFFANYEGVRNRRGAFAAGRTPVAEERSGVFRETIYDPLTTNAASIRQPFAGNRIPSTRFDPVAVSLSSLYPQPNTGGANNFISNAPSSDDENQYNFRLDQHFSPNHRLFGRLSINRFHGLLPDEYGNIASPRWEHNTNNLAVVLDDTLTQSPSLILNLRYGFTRNYNDRIAYSFGTDLTRFGWPKSFSDARQGPVLPQITLAGFVQLSRATLADNAGQVHAFGANVSKSAGRHFLKFGVDYRVYQRNETNKGNVANFSFNAGLTRGPDAVRGGNGNSYASFLLRYPAGGANNFVAPFATTSLYNALYLQASTHALVEFVDIYLTLAEVCGLPSPARLEGFSMAPLLAEPDRAWKKAAFSQFPRPWPNQGAGSVMGYSMKTDRYRYTEWLGGSRELLSAELYDHSVDPGETANLAGSPQGRDVTARLSGMLQAGWKGSACDLIPMTTHFIPLGANGHFPTYGGQTMSFLLLTEEVALLLDAGSGVSRLTEPAVRKWIAPYRDLQIILSHYTSIM